MSISLGDATITADDVNLLSPPNWLNDQIISFWCEHLRLTRLSDNPNVLFILPNIAYFISQFNENEDISALVPQIISPQRELIIIVLNDASSLDSDAAKPLTEPRGSHWSVLVYERRCNTFYSLDSLAGRPANNRGTAKKFYNKIEKLLRKANDSAIDFKELATPTQTNSYDCGIFVCLFAESLVEGFLQGDRVETTIHKLHSNCTSPSDEMRTKIIAQVADYQAHNESPK